MNYRSKKTSFFIGCFYFIVGFLINMDAGAQEKNENIRLNQIGFYPDAPKAAIVIGAAEGEFHVVTESGKKVFSGKLSESVPSKFSGKQGRVADFSSVNKPGTYHLQVPGFGRSYAFTIAKNVHQAVGDAALKSFYYQRASFTLSEKYAGKWHRPAGHPDTKVMVHASAASDSRPEGSIFESSKGWYDAGDYGKYVVNSGITMGTMLSLYEDFPDYFNKRKNLNIPESGDNVPDLLDELVWNLRWILTMQDPEDGGVYHKMTTANFEGMIMPHEAVHQRYFIKKSTTAALDFAAVLAQASRVFRAYAEQFPGLSDSCLVKAEKAWSWAKRNPGELYNQNAVNEKYDPDINTGAYGDRDARDEFLWAAAELFVTTKNEDYFDEIAIAEADEMKVPSWGNVQLLGYYSLLRHEKELPVFATEKMRGLRANLISFADKLGSGANENIYQTVMGQNEKDFVWGSNAVAANQSIALIQAYQLTEDKKYLVNALSNLDYILGRNGTGYSFVTGYGAKTPMFIHHRPSEADGIEDPVPGFLAGGPNPGQQDGCNYSSAIPDESYTDETCSYASNEIAINWNAPLVYLIYALESLQNKF